MLRASYDYFEHTPSSLESRVNNSLVIRIPPQEGRGAEPRIAILSTPSHTLARRTYFLTATSGYAPTGEIPCASPPHE